MKKNILLLLFLCMSSLVYAQLQMGREPDVPSAQTWNFIKYGNAKANLHTGMVNVNVPFYVYQDKDFEIPISFDYASDGFKPNSLAGILGHDWVLNVGGCITREVRGIPDDVIEKIRKPIPIGLGMIEEIRCKGFHYLHSTSYLGFNLEDFSFAINDMDNVVAYFNVNNISYYDTEPDIFHFNFMGYSGSFYFWHNGETRVYQANTYNGEFRIKMNINTNPDQEYHYSTFEITTGDGYKYIFGNYNYKGGANYEPAAATSIGFDYTIKKDANNDDSGYPVIKTWKLIKIIAPNGREAEFHYTMVGREYFDENDRRAANIREYYPVSTAQQAVEYSSSGECSVNYRTRGIIDSCGTFTDYLTSISVDGAPYINLFYSENKGEIVKHVTNNSWQQKVRQIENIYLRLDSIVAPWKTCSFTYKYPTYSSGNDPINKIPFLDSINISGEGSYVFEYYNRTDKAFPHIGTFSLDHWGYYNGQNERDPQIDLAEIFENNTENFTEKIKPKYATLREPLPAFAIMGMLGWIKYPTGGYTVLHYEPHKYSTAVKRVLAYDYVPTLLNVLPEKIAGGLRICKIDNYTSNSGIAETTTYTYKKEDNTSSGTLMHFPRYGISYMAESQYRTKKYSYKSLMDIWSYDKSHIEYSRIIEKKADSSSIIYNYPDYLTIPNKSATGVRVEIPTSLCSQSGVAFYQLNNYKTKLITNILMPDMSLFSERNKIATKNIIDNTGKLLRSERWKYDPNVGANTHKSYTIAGENYIISNRYAIDYPKKQANVTNYFAEGGDSINENTFYTYNTKGQTTAISTKDSKNNSKQIQYKYVTDVNNPNGVLATMINNNVISYPLSEKIFINQNLSEHREYTYKEVGVTYSGQKIIRIGQVESYNKETGNLEVDAKYNYYDKYGNLLESENRNGIKTCYLWGYEGRYLVAKIINCSLFQLKDINGLTNIENAPLNDSISLYESAIRSIPEAEVTSFYYAKYSRLTQIIDPSGHVIKYDYTKEQHGKLGEMENELGKFTKYNYSTDQN